MSSLEESGGTVTTAFAHAHAEVGWVVIWILLPGVPLISAGLVLSCSITLSNASVKVLKNLISSMVVLNRDSRGKIGDGVFVMCYSKLSKLAIWESCIGGVTNSWLTKVYHSCRNAIFDESHCLKSSECSTEAVTSCLDCVGRELGLKAADFGKNIVIDWSDCLLETGMNITVAFRPLDINILGCIKVGYPVIYWFRTSVGDIDWFIRW